MAKKELEKLLNTFDDEFRSLKLTQLKMFNFIIHLRDRCAHIILGNHDSPGIIGLDSPDAQAVETFLPLFWKIAGRHLNDRYGQDGTLVFTPIEPPPPREFR
jgi:hypothetical protein